MRAQGQPARAWRLSHKLATVAAGAALTFAGVAVGAGPSSAAPLAESVHVASGQGLAQSTTYVKRSKYKKRYRTSRSRTRYSHRYTKRRVVRHAAPRPAPVSGPVGDPRAYARSVLDPTQFSCLDKLFAKESGWNARAANRSSGAYGIPQALPGSKMASAGADWRTNPVTQVRWGLSYINSRYGSPCAAWSHSVRSNWY